MVLENKLGITDWAELARWEERISKIKVLLRAALTNRINDREVYMKGVDASYHYEGYDVYRTADIGGKCFRRK